MPGRSDNEIKNHWHTHLKSRASVRRDQSMVKNERVRSLEVGDVNPKGFLVKKPNLKNQQEVDILLAVLSSDQLPSTSSTSESCSLSVLDYAVSNEFKQQFNEQEQNLWNDILSDNDSFISSSGTMYSPLGFTDDLISQVSLNDYIMDDLSLRST